MANFHTAVAVTIAISLLTTTATAHSNLGKPLAYNPTACKASEEWCRKAGACPPLWRSGKAKARNSVENPAATWARGEEVEIIWHKNNHVGGFYRRSLVPVEHMFSHKWHKLTAFDYGCWQQGTFQCGKSDVCGGDQKGRAYKNKVVIPAVFPDGVYIFAQVWIGGLHWKGRYPKYSDYFACSFVRIQGGIALQKAAAATFTGPEKKCASGSTRPLECGGESCGDKCGLESCPEDSVKVTVPDEFKDGAIPKVFLANIDPKAKPGTETVPVLKSETPVTVPEENEVTKQDATEKEVATAEEPVPAEEKAAIIEDKKDMINDITEAKEEAADKEPEKYMKGPLKSLRVFIDNEMERELMDGDEATISLGGKDITFEAYTEGEKVGTIHFEINDKTKWKESASPYVFMGNKGTVYNAWKKPIMNKQFQFGLILWRKGKRYSISTKLTLKK